MLIIGFLRLILLIPFLTSLFLFLFYLIRYLYMLKCYVSNKAFIEGSIEKGYNAIECLTFCSMYLHGVETKSNKVDRNYDGSNSQETQGFSIFSHNCQPLSKGEYG